MGFSVTIAQKSGVSPHRCLCTSLTAGERALEGIGGVAASGVGSAVQFSESMMGSVVSAGRRSTRTKTGRSLPRVTFGSRYGVVGESGSGGGAGVPPAGTPGGVQPCGSSQELLRV